MVRMIVKTVLAKGQIVIPKTIRDLLGIHVGDEVVIEVENEKVILSKKEDPVDVFYEVSRRHKKKISMEDIKKTLEERYEDD